MPTLGRMSSPTDPRGIVHRALASDSRRALLQELERAAEPLEAATLAEALELHITTVRGHLQLLGEAGLVASTSVRSGRRGRPTLVYTAMARDDDASGAGYQLLAEILIDGLQRSPMDTTPPSDWARWLGRRWGPELIARQGLATVGPAEAVLVRSFDQLGFEPEMDEGGSEVRLRACPFAGLAMGNEDIICDLHLGMAQGMLETLDTDVEAHDLVPFAEPSLCRLSLSDPTDSSVRERPKGGLRGRERD